MIFTRSFKKLLPHLVVLAFFFGLSTLSVYAQGTTDPCAQSNPDPAKCGKTQGVSGKIDNPFKGAGNSLEELFLTIINNIIIPIGAVLAVLAFIYAGFMYVTAAGNDAKIKTAHQALLYAAIGTAVLIGSGVIAKVLENTIKQLQ